MHKAPYSERADFFRFQHAFQSFTFALKSLKSLEASRENTLETWEEYCLWAPFVTTYWRPFNGRPIKDFGLEESIVPQHLKPWHHTIRDTRNKVFAHADANYKPKGSNQFLTSVVMEMDQGNKPNFGMGYSWPGIKGESISPYFQLVTHLIQISAEKSIIIWDKWKRHLDPSVLGNNKLWRVNIDISSDEVFLPEL